MAEIIGEKKVGPLKQEWLEIHSTVIGMEADVDKAQMSGNKAAVRRARKSLQQVKELAQKFRKSLQDSVS